MATLAFALLFAAFAASSRLVAAHGYLQYPESRNYQAYRSFIMTGFYCPQCGQGAGGVPSICGDPYQGYSAPFRPFTQRFFRFTNLTQGQTFKALVSITANHGGRMSMAVCPLPRDQVTQDCFNKPENQLRRVNADPLYNNKRYWYLRAGSEFQETFKLPDGVSCDKGCMLQWWWIGFQTCAMRCEDTMTDDVAGECGKNLLVSSSMPFCASPASAEQYYNCVDVIIRSSGPATQSPPSSSAATQSPPPRPAATSPPSIPAGTSPPPGPFDCPIADQTAFCRAEGVGLFPDPCSDSSFFTCGPGGSGGRHSCPTGLVFDSNSRQCEWPANIQ